MRLTTRLTALVPTSALALAGLVALSVSTAGPASAAAQVFPVPTSSAGLARITTAPNGDMWFVEKEANKIGRITPSGQITEFPTRFSGDYSQTMDLDVAPDGRVWVTNDSGREISVYSSTGQLLDHGSLGDYPYGGDVRVDPTGTVWITMNYDESYVARVVNSSTITASANSPECDDTLGEAANGAMWCARGAGITALDADGSGGTTYPVGVGATNPVALTAGPTGSIWYASQLSGTFATSPSNGEVGYLAGASPVRFNTGSRTAPNDLVRGPDNAMWFTSVGAAKGIGHLDAAGRGALTQVGGHAPESLTFGPDGAVWFTDATNNAIVRVPTSDLQTTNVDPGAGSVFSVDPETATAKPPVKITGKNKVRLTRGRVPLTLSCPKGTAGGCRGKVVLTTARASRKPGAGKKATAKVLTVSAPVTFTLKAGTKTTVRPRLTRLGTKVVKRGKATKIAVTVGGAPIGTLTVRR